VIVRVSAFFLLSLHFVATLLLGELLPGGAKRRFLPVRGGHSRRRQEPFEILTLARRTTWCARSAHQ